MSFDDIAMDDGSFGSPAATSICIDKNQMPELNYVGVLNGTFDLAPRLDEVLYKRGDVAMTRAAEDIAVDDDFESCDVVSPGVIKELRDTATLDDMLPKSRAPAETSSYNGVALNKTDVALNETYRYDAYSDTEIALNPPIATVSRTDGGLNVTDNTLNRTLDSFNQNDAVSNQTDDAFNRSNDDFNPIDFCDASDQANVAADEKDFISDGYYVASNRTDASGQFDIAPAKAYTQNRFDIGSDKMELALGRMDVGEEEESSRASQSSAAEILLDLHRQGAPSFQRHEPTPLHEREATSFDLTPASVSFLTRNVHDVNLNRDACSSQNIRGADICQTFDPANVGGVASDRNDSLVTTRHNGADLTQSYADFPNRNRIGDASIGDDDFFDGTSVNREMFDWSRSADDQQRENAFNEKSSPNAGSSWNDELACDDSTAMNRSFLHGASDHAYTSAVVLSSTDQGSSASHGGASNALVNSRKRKIHENAYGFNDPSSQFADDSLTQEAAGVADASWKPYGSHGSTWNTESYTADPDSNKNPTAWNRNADNDAFWNQDAAAAGQIARSPWDQPIIWGQDCDPGSGPEIQDFGPEEEIVEAPSPQPAAPPRRPTFEDFDEDACDVPLTSDLQRGYRILRDIMVDAANRSTSLPFLNAVDSALPGCADYYERIQRPMWLYKIKEKFESDAYRSVVDFLADMQLVVENCYRFNGPDHSVSKLAQRLETVLQQKVNILPTEIKEKCLAFMTGMSEDAARLGVRRPKAALRGVVGPGGGLSGLLLVNKLRREARERAVEAQRQAGLRRRANLEQFLTTDIPRWEQGLFECGRDEQMRTMWELPEIGQFLFLCSIPLKLVGEVTQCRLERCLLMPKESLTLRLIMSSLLSTEKRRLSLTSKTSMPYWTWNGVLRKMVAHWYKVLADRNNDVPLASIKLGFEETFFKVAGLRNPLERKAFHELSFYRRVWILKSLCDFQVMRQKSLARAIESQALLDQRGLVLGRDEAGSTYVHFPLFCGEDLRIYRQAPPSGLSEAALWQLEKTPPRIVARRGRRRRHGGVRRRRRGTPVAKAMVAKQQQEEALQSPLRLRDGRLRQNPKQVESFQATNDDLDSFSSEENSGSDVEKQKEDDEETEEEEEMEKPAKSEPKNEAKDTKKPESEIDIQESEEEVSPPPVKRTRVSTKSSDVVTTPSARNAPSVPSRHSTPQQSLLSNEIEMGGGGYPRRSLRKVIEESIRDGGIVPDEGRGRRGGRGRPSTPRNLAIRRGASKRSASTVFSEAENVLDDGSVARRIESVPSHRRGRRSAAMARKDEEVESENSMPTRSSARNSVASDWSGGEADALEKRTRRASLCGIVCMTHNSAQEAIQPTNKAAVVERTSIIRRPGRPRKVQSNKKESYRPDELSVSATMQKQSIDDVSMVTILPEDSNGDGQTETEKVDEANEEGDVIVSRGRCEKNKARSKLTQTARLDINDEGINVVPADIEDVDIFNYDQLHVARHEDGKNSDVEKFKLESFSGVEKEFVKKVTAESSEGSDATESVEKEISAWSDEVNVTVDCVLERDKTEESAKKMTIKSVETGVDSVEFIGEMKCLAPVLGQDNTEAMESTVEARSRDESNIASSGNEACGDMMLPEENIRLNAALTSNASVGKALRKRNNMGCVIEGNDSLAKSPRNCCAGESLNDCLSAELLKDSFEEEFVKDGCMKEDLEKDDSDSEKSLGFPDPLTRELVSTNSPSHLPFGASSESLVEATLSVMKFEGDNVDDAKLHDVKLDDVKFDDAKLIDAKLDDTNLNDEKAIDTKFDDTNLNDAKSIDIKFNDARPEREASSSPWERSPGNCAELDGKVEEVKEEEPEEDFVGSWEKDAAGGSGVPKEGVGGSKGAEGGEQEEEEEEEIVPDSGIFRLVCESVEDLRGLITQLGAELKQLDDSHAEDDSGSSSQYKVWLAKKHSTTELIERLERLLAEVRPFEDKISKACVATKVALYREQENYRDEEPEQDEADWCGLDSPTGAGNCDGDIDSGGEDASRASSSFFTPSRNSPRPPGPLGNRQGRGPNRSKTGNHAPSSSASSLAGGSIAGGRSTRSRRAGKPSGSLPGEGMPVKQPRPPPRDRSTAAFISMIERASLGDQQRRNKNNRKKKQGGAADASLSVNQALSGSVVTAVDSGGGGAMGGGTGTPGVEGSGAAGEGRLRPTAKRKPLTPEQRLQQQQRRKLKRQQQQSALQQQGVGLLSQSQQQWLGGSHQQLQQQQDSSISQQQQANKRQRPVHQQHASFLPQSSTQPTPQRYILSPGGAGGASIVPLLSHSSGNATPQLIQPPFKPSAQYRIALPSGPSRPLTADELRRLFENPAFLNAALTAQIRAASSQLPGAAGSRVVLVPGAASGAVLTRPVGGLSLPTVPRSVRIERPGLHTVTPQRFNVALPGGAGITTSDFIRRSSEVVQPSICRPNLVVRTPLSVGMVQSNCSSHSLPMTSNTPQRFIMAQSLAGILMIPPMPPRATVSSVQPSRQILSSPLRLSLPGVGSSSNQVSLQRILDAAALCGVSEACHTSVALDATSIRVGVDSVHIVTSEQSSLQPGLFQFSAISPSPSNLFQLTTTSAVIGRTLPDVSGNLGSSVAALQTGSPNKAKYASSKTVKELLVAGSGGAKGHSIARVVGVASVSEGPYTGGVLSIPSSSGVAPNRSHADADVAHILVDLCGGGKGDESRFQRAPNVVAPAGVSSVGFGVRLVTRMTPGVARDVTETTTVVRYPIPALNPTPMLTPTGATIGDGTMSGTAGGGVHPRRIGLLTPQHGSLNAIRAGLVGGGLAASLSQQSLTGLSHSSLGLFSVSVPSVGVPVEPSFAGLSSGSDLLGQASSALPGGLVSSHLADPCRGLGASSAYVGNILPTSNTSPINLSSGSSDGSCVKVGLNRSAVVQPSCQVTDAFQSSATLIGDSVQSSSNIVDQSSLAFTRPSSAAGLVSINIPLSALVSQGSRISLGGMSSVLPGGGNVLLGSLNAAGNRVSFRASSAGSLPTASLLGVPGGGTYLGTSARPPQLIYKIVSGKGVSSALSSPRLTKDTGCKLSQGHASKVIHGNVGNLGQGHGIKVNLVQGGIKNSNISGSSGVIRNLFHSRVAMQGNGAAGILGLSGAAHREDSIKGIVPGIGEAVRSPAGSFLVVLPPGSKSPSIVTRGSNPSSVFDPLRSPVTSVVPLRPAGALGGLQATHAAGLTARAAAVGAPAVVTTIRPRPLCDIRPLGAPNLDAGGDGSVAARQRKEVKTTARTNIAANHIAANIPSLTNQIVINNIAGGSDGREANRILSPVKVTANHLSIKPAVQVSANQLSASSVSLANLMTVAADDSLLHLVPATNAIESGGGVEGGTTDRSITDQLASKPISLTLTARSPQGLQQTSCQMLQQSVTPRKGLHQSATPRQGFPQSQVIRLQSVQPSAGSTVQLSVRPPPPSAERHSTQGLMGQPAPQSAAPTRLFIHPSVITASAGTVASQQQFQQQQLQQQQQQQQQQLQMTGAVIAAAAQPTRIIVQNVGGRLVLPDGSALPPAVMSRLQAVVPSGGDKASVGPKLG